MHCKSCEMLITDALNEKDGIKQISINHRSGTADVEFDETKIKKEEIIETIKKEGYKVRK